MLKNAWLHVEAKKKPTLPLPCLASKPHNPNSSLTLKPKRIPHPNPNPNPNPTLNLNLNSQPSTINPIQSKPYPLSQILTLDPKPENLDPKPENRAPNPNLSTNPDDSYPKPTLTSALSPNYNTNPILNPILL
jgi:hypothetical protein